MNGSLLTSDADLQSVSNIFFDLTHVSMPLEYLRRGTVMAWLFDGRIAAAFACITKPPYRVLSVLREDQLDPYLKSCIEGGLVCELNGLFVLPEFKNAVRAGNVIKVALRSFVDSGRKCALFGYNREREGLSILYQRALLSPTTLLDGEVVLPSGLTSVSRVFLGYLRADHIRKAFRL